MHVKRESKKKVSFKFKNIVSTPRPLALLHMNLFGPSRAKGLGGNYYGFVIVDDYSIFCWTIFLRNKDETFLAFTSFANKLSSNIVAIRSDHGGEFGNHLSEDYYDKLGIGHNFSAPRTP